MKHLKLELQKAIEAYQKGDSKTKNLLIDLYGKEYFLTDIKDRIIDYESACKELNFEPLSIYDFEMLPEEDRNRYYARHQLTIGIRASNQGWSPNWDDSNEYKYYNYFYKNKGGFGCRVSYCYSDSGLGSDLHFKNSDLAEHANKVFKQQYIDFLF